MVLWDTDFSRMHTETITLGRYSVVIKSIKNKKTLCSFTDGRLTALFSCGASSFYQWLQLHLTLTAYDVIGSVLCISTSERVLRF